MFYNDKKDITTTNIKFSLKNFKNIQSKKSKKWDFSKGFLSKIGNFSIFLF